MYNILCTRFWRRTRPISRIKRLSLVPWYASPFRSHESSSTFWRKRTRCIFSSAVRNSQRRICFNFQFSWPSKGNLLNVWSRMLSVFFVCTSNSVLFISIYDYCWMNWSNVASNIYGFLPYLTLWNIFAKILYRSKMAALAMLN